MPSIPFGKRASPFIRIKIGRPCTILSTSAHKFYFRIKNVFIIIHLTGKYIFIKRIADHFCQFKTTKIIISIFQGFGSGFAILRIRNKSQCEILFPSVTSVRRPPRPLIGCFMIICLKGFQGIEGSYAFVPRVCQKGYRVIADHAPSFAGKRP